MFKSAVFAIGVIGAGASFAAGPVVPGAVKPAIVVLVHGAWADGSSWRRVIPLLQSRGVDVVAVQLDLKTLKDDADIVTRAISAQPGKLVLVGHSYGGAVITQAGVDAKVAGLVYVAAFAPGNGESIADMTKPFPAPPWQAGLVADRKGYLSLNQSTYVASFASDLPRAEALALAATQGPIFNHALADKVDVAAWKTKPSRWILSGADAMVPAPFQQAQAARIGAQVTAVPGASHVVMLSHPGEVSDIILAAMRDARCRNVVGDKCISVSFELILMLRSLLVSFPLRRAMFKSAVTLFVLLGLMGSAHATSPVGPVGLAIVIKPLVTDGKVTAIDVQEQLLANGPPAGTLLRLHAPLAVYGVPVLADKIVGLTVSDANGPLPLTIENDPKPAGYDTAYRHWQTTRPAVLPVTVHYRIAVEAATQGGPPFGMKASGGGVAGVGLGFLLLPENSGSAATRVGWDLSALPPGSVGAVTFGAGPAIVEGPPDMVRSQWMLAGPARVFNATRTPGFQAYVLGNPPFDTDAIVDWADRAYAYLSTALTSRRERPYRLFIRTLDIPSYATGSARPQGGGALMTVGSTLGTPDRPQTLGDFKNFIFHEMTHQWVGEAPNAGAWFVEGATTYLSAVLPCEAGLESAQFCADGVNKFADMYYGAPGRNWSQAKIAGVAVEDVRLVPYGRGLLYLGQLNSQLLAHSQGQRNLKDVLAQLFADRAHGVPIDDAVWEAMLLRELGPDAIDEFRASVVDGSKTIIPPDGAFGPCLTRVRVAMTIKATGQPVDGYHWVPRACAQ
jgi:pimeloyl-ACP methyl ester carboxylesterase